MKRFAVCCFALLFLCITANAQDLPSISEKTNGLKKYEGYFTYYWDKDQAKVWLEIDDFNKPFLYVDALAAGVGSNDIGLDRNQLGDSKVVYFDRRGPKVLLVQPNQSYRASSTNPKEKKSVHDAFAQSILWGFKVGAKEDGRVLVDMTDFLLRDAHDVAGRLKSTHQGNYHLDDSRSALYPEGIMNFPKNTEFEATLTLTGDASGGEIRSVTPSPDAVTVREHHSFIQLPDDNYQPRKFDPRAGYFDVSYQDYSTPIGEPITKRFITRHRLKKKNPDAKLSEPVKPIVYYVDKGAPEPIKSALVEGASWWNQAFEAVGYKNAFQVKVLPDSANPLDVRYNVINWVHRSTRGWSYGTSIVDPRTGEIIKANILLGSLRVRQDYLIAEGLLAPYKDGIPKNEKDDPMLQMALARVRQLAAHETGHTLGLAHNFAASISGRASVMDYPAPMVKIKDDGSFDLSKAYNTGIGAWDKVAIKYGYQSLPSETNNYKQRTAVLDSAIHAGFEFISDADARPAGGAHPDAHLWDNGKDAVQQLRHTMYVRRLALKKFSENNIRPGEPMAKLQDVLVPIYLYHRYQLKAVAKLIGGLNYSYNVRGDSQPNPKPVAPKRQKAALDGVLKTIRPDALRMPKRIVNLIPPRPLGYYGSRELFHSHTDPAFDPLGAAETASNMTAGLLFNPARAARLVDYHARDEENIGFNELIKQVLNATWNAKTKSGYDAAVQRTVDFVVLYQMIQLAMNEDASAQVRAMTDQALSNLKSWLNSRDSGSAQWNAAYHYGAKLIDDYQHHPERIKSISKPLSPPPGSPIGGGFEF